MSPAPADNDTLTVKRLMHDLEAAGFTPARLQRHVPFASFVRRSHEVAAAAEQPIRCLMPDCGRPATALNTRFWVSDLPVPQFAAWCDEHFDLFMGPPLWAPASPR